jgi:hypothetical protein
MVFTLILPEFLGAKAYAGMRLTRRSVDQVKSFKAFDGGSLSEEEISNWTKTHAYCAEMGGFVIRLYGARNMDTGVVATADILELRRNGLLPTLPRITAEHLNDLSNGDPLTKAAAIGQVSWIVVQIIARAANRLPRTQLEITACGFAASTLLTYLLWWAKPQAIRSVTELQIPSDFFDPFSELQNESCQHRLYGVRELVIRSPTGQYRKLADNEPMPNDSLSGEVGHCLVIDIRLGIMVLGGIQCAAWNFDFPTTIESHLWRCSSITTVSTYLVMFLFFCFIPSSQFGVNGKLTEVGSHFFLSCFWLGGVLFFSKRCIRSFTCRQEHLFRPGHQIFFIQLEKH